MKLLFCISVFIIVVLTEAKKRKEPDCCDNWEPFFEPLTKGCKECMEMENNVTAINKCFIKKWYPLNADGSLDKHKYAETMTDEENLFGSQKRIKKIKKGISNCTKNGAKNRAQFSKVDECIYDVYRKYCPEAGKKLEEQEENRYFRGCK